MVGEAVAGDPGILRGMNKTEMRCVANTAFILRNNEHAELAGELEQLLIRELLNDNDDPSTTESVPTIEDTLTKTKRRRRGKKLVRRTLSEADLNKIAQAYNESEPGGRTAAISEAFGCSPSSVGYYVKRARELEYIA
jgi:hypothetical protein